MMNRHPVPSLDACLSELLHEEKRIVTQAAREHRATVRAPISVAYAAQGRHTGREMHEMRLLMPTTRVLTDFLTPATPCVKNQSLLFHPMTL